MALKMNISNRILTEKFKEKYRFDDSRKIWIKKGFLGIKYSDGETIEKEIHNIIKSTVDKGIFSNELRAHIKDWPTEYHLSASRHLALKPFIEDIQKPSFALEIGAGCGAISRYLSEKCEQLVCIEGSIERATIAAARCSDLKNITIICDNFIDMEIGVKFDLVTLIGVLEYSRIYSGTKNNDPTSYFLRKIQQHLSNSGILITAIENQLGLKYFNNYPEDHTNIPFYGINDRYNKDSVVTFGKTSIEKIFEHSGFKENKFIYPFPDYKTPKAFIFDKTLKTNDYGIADFIGFIRPKNHNNPYRLFEQKKLIEILIENQLLCNLSNSFIILSSIQKPITLNEDILSMNFSFDRKKEYITETKTIIKESSILVQKKALFHSTNSNKFFSHNTRETSPYIKGISALSLILNHNLNEFNLDTFIDSLSIWVDYLIEKSYYNNNSTRFLKGRYWDCIPRNLIMNKQGKLTYIDDEWLVFRDIPIFTPITRGVFSLIEDIPFFLEIDELTPIELIDNIFKKYNLNYTESDKENFCNLEKEMQEEIFFKSIDYKTILQKPIIRNESCLNNNHHKKLSESAQLKRINNHIIFGKLLNIWRIIKKDNEFGKHQENQTTTKK